MKQNKGTILFVLHRIGIGGSMTSMLNLIELLKHQGINVDLFLMEHEGAFLERAKQAANLIDEDKFLSATICNKQKLIKAKKVSNLIIRLIYVCMHNLFGSAFINMSLYKWRAKKLSGKYDNVVAYQENITTQFVQYIKAPNKIAWVHSDYCRFANNSTLKEMQEVYDRYQFIVCVSKAVALGMMKNLDKIDDKIRIIYNTINLDYIKSKSVENKFHTEKGYINLVSVGRFAEEKKFDRIIEIAKELIKDDYKLIWYIIGNGDLFESISAKVNSNNLNGVIKLLGAKENPYPVIAATDYLVITSLYEAHPMVAIEALILHKPVISTVFSSVFEVINDKENGLICENNANGLYSGIKSLMENEELQKKIKLGAQRFNYNNDSILMQVAELLY